MARWLRWEPGRDDLVPFIGMAVPMLIWALVAGDQPATDLTGIAAAIGLGLLLKHLLPPHLADLAVVPPVLALLIEASAFVPSIVGLFLAALTGVGLLVWVGSDVRTGVALRDQLEPALVPSLAVGLAVAVMFFLPGSSGAQVGLAVLALVGVLALSAWLYLRSADELAASPPTS